MGRHLHLFIRAEVRKPLLTTERAADFISRAVALAGMKVIDGPHAVLGVVPGNEGVSTTAILDLSSTALHEWPHRKPPLIQFDLFTCGRAPNEEAFFRLFQELDPIRFDARLIDRDNFLGIFGAG